MAKKKTNKPKLPSALKDAKFTGLSLVKDPDAPGKVVEVIKGKELARPEEGSSRAPVTHDLKTWPRPFQAVKLYAKRFEYRKNDRDYQKGDTLLLREFEPCGTCQGTGLVLGSSSKTNCSRCNEDHGEYTGREVLVDVLYILSKDIFGFPKGYACMSISEPVVPHKWAGEECSVCSVSFNEAEANTSCEGRPRVDPRDAA